MTYFLSFDAILNELPIRGKVHYLVCHKRRSKVGLLFTMIYWKHFYKGIFESVSNTIIEKNVFVILMISKARYSFDLNAFDVILVGFGF